MRENDDIYETAELYNSDDVTLYVKHGWILLDVKDRPWRKGEDDDSCPVIFVMKKMKGDIKKSSLIGIQPPEKSPT